MPELPEVEVTRRQIAPLLLDRRIARVETTPDSYFFLTPPATLKKRLRGRVVCELDRLGKYLVARLDDDSRLLLHLGMTGQLFAPTAVGARLLASTRGGALTPERQRGGFRPDAHTHLRFRFADGDESVFFRDTRKFGKVQWLAAGEACERLDRLGVDALRVRSDRFHRATRSRKAAIKSVLLDQSVLAGVGSIYADEALFRVGVRPARPACKLTQRESAELVRALKRVMRRAIATGGSSISDYVQPDGSRGRYQDERRVYARAGEPCSECDTPIKRIVLAQRSACYCPTCQK